MGDKRNFAALDWVMGEISETLREARQSLEAYVEDPKDTTRIRFCLTHIHQVHGSLQMVEFHGGALLAEEMEQTAQAIMENTVSSIPEAQEVLMRGLLQLPIFLEHVKNVKEDNPARVMPLLNDMRAVRKQSYLSETNLFSPDFSRLKEVSGPRHSVLKEPEKLKQVLKKLREMYQFAAASVLRGIKVDENLEYLDKVFARLELLTQGTPASPIWEVSAALVEALKSDDLELTVAVRGLLRYIARELRILGEKAPDVLESPPRESLLKNLLFYVARAEENERSKKVAAVKEKYGLRTALLGENKRGETRDDLLQAPDADAIRSVVVGLQDELGNIKHILDLSLSGQISTADLKDVLPSVKRVSDTLAVLGIGDLRKQMIEQSERLERISEANTLDEEELTVAANKIIEIEHRLKAISKSAGKRNDLANVNEREVEIDNAKATVVKECAAGLQRCKESIIDYISSQWDKQHLENVGMTLTEVRGGLQMIPLRRPAAIVHSCAQFIQEKLVDGAEHPSFQTLESLADAIASVEYYLERLMEDLYEDSDAMLDIAEESMANLGYEIDTSAVAPIAEPVSKEALVDVEETNVESLSSFEDAEDERADTLLAESPASVKAELAGQDMAATTDVSRAESAAPSVPEKTATSTPEKAAAPAPRAPEFESDIDDEIIEIFIEEAGEVLETLGEYFPKWREKETDQDALVIVRRAFHTLKGSGRMVEAFDIGELAWAVENMLNRVIDRTIRLQPHVFNLAQAVIDLAPTLVKAFEARQANPEKALTEQYEAWGHQISEGNFPEELAKPLPPFVASSNAAALQEIPTHTDHAVADESSANTAYAAVNESVPQPLADDEDDDEVDSVLQEIFSQESITHLATLEDFVKHMDREAPLYAVPSDDLQRALHTLKGSAKMAQVWPIAEVTEPLEHFTKELITFQVRVDEDILQLLRDAIDYTRSAIGQIDNNEKVQIPQTELFLARTKELRELYVGHLVAPRDADEAGSSKVDPRMLSLVMAEEMALLLDADSLLRDWQKNGSAGPELEKLLSELAVLGEGARQANLPSMASLCALLHQANTVASEGKIAAEDEFFARMHEGHECLLGMVDAVAAGQNMVTPSVAMTDGIRALIAAAPAEITASPDDESVFDNDSQADDSISQTGSDGQAANYEVEFDTLPVANDDAELEAQSSSESSPWEEGVESEELASIAFSSDETDATWELPPEEDETFAAASLTSASPTFSAEVDADEDPTLEEQHEEGSFDTHSEADDRLVSELSNDDDAFATDTSPAETELDVESTLEEQIQARAAEPNTFAETSFSYDTTETPFELNLEESSATEEITPSEPASLSNDDQEITFEGWDSDLGEDDEIHFDFSDAADGPVEGDTTLLDPTDAGFTETDTSEPDTSETDAAEIETTQFILDESGEFLAESPLDASSSESVDEEVQELALDGDAWSLEEVNEFDPSAIEDDVTVIEETDPLVSEFGFPDSVDDDELVLETIIADIVSDDSLSPENNAESIADEAPIAEPSAPVPQRSGTAIVGLIDRIDTASEDYDRDILEVFMEEADELVEGMDEAIHTWESNWSDAESLEEIKRILHTLKGGARLSGLSNLGDIVHDYETMLIEMGDDMSDVDQAFFGRVHRYQDRILGAVKGVRGFLASDLAVGEIDTGADHVPPHHEVETDGPDSPLVADEEDASADLDDAPLTKKFTPAADSSNVLRFAPKAKDQAKEFSMPAVSGGGGGNSGGPSVSGGGAKPAFNVALKKAAPQEVVKVSSELLEELVNLAGETSINRSRLEQYVNDFSFSLDEVDATLNRLQDQLRRLDMETEAQILFRQEQMEAHDEFDPLEMDRYSNLQQLSRSLIESSSDLMDLKTDLRDKLRYTETLLLQQSRINTTLQEGLMRSRMVPFSRLVPRLRRIVRQVASELGKNVSFELDNVEGELDRSVLERMVPPFEHMLRNAVDHGIESPEQRIAAGKSETGRIVLTLSREGGDVLIQLADDGKGVDLKRVREKAIERELMAPDAELSDHDVMQFILHAGFSTAENVTQISGRGVGMDVVHAEIKQLGGSVTINSAWGKGTEFVVRLPFTLSVNRALMVSIGQDSYAVPLSSIEGIVRVSPFELEHYYANPEAQFEYANENYHVRYLGGLLHTGATPVLDGHVLPLPVLLVRSHEHTMALQVDAVMGSREIVVKSLGVQFSTVAGLSGATVMGDGSVVVILDPHALVRQEIARATLQLGRSGYQSDIDERVEDRIRTIMVVDDSVTVRKVTTRFLEREGFEVITAKDGMDAIRLLQEGIPDLMLLDIEMPRMDGFEVAKTVRNTQRWEHLPIIMITSRTGDKHREHAMSLGVNNYLGKPYQEDILLEAIGEILDYKSSRA